MNRVLEVCVDGVDSALKAMRAGADRLVVCSDLILGGTTPDVNLFYEVRNHLDLPVSVLIRPRCGDYCYTPGEFEIMKNAAAMFHDAGADSLLAGILMPDGALDVLRMDELVVAAKRTPLILNRAFDFCRSPAEAFEQAKMMGLGGVLTSGQCRRCYDGRGLIAQMILNADGLEIDVTGEIEPRELSAFCRVTAARVFHFSGQKKTDSSMTYRKERLVGELPSGMDEYSIWETDLQKLAAVRAALDAGE
ncbi:Copper homeostasis protein CutC [Ruminococcaceae bacterium BL-6]|nr:Copper homeostasis protein CutC [Ruminococcaceae bacterium BL-6]